MLRMDLNQPGLVSSPCPQRSGGALTGQKGTDIRNTAGREMQLLGSAKVTLALGTGGRCRAERPSRGLFWPASSQLQPHIILPPGRQISYLLKLRLLLFGR